MHTNTTAHRLIGDKSLQLCETPRMECCALRPTSLDPRADVRQIFHSNRPLRAFGLRNNPFGENVVDLLGKSIFLTGEYAQPPAATKCAELLEFVPEPSMPVAHVLDRLARMDFPIAVGCDVRHTQVNAKYIVNIYWFGRFTLSSRKEIPVTTHKRQIGFTMPERKQLSLPFTTHERDFLPPVECPNRSSRVLVGVGQYPLIVGDRTKGLKCAQRLPLQFVGIRDFGDTTHRQLCGKAKRFAHGAVGQPVDGELSKDARTPCDMADVITGGIRRLKGAFEHIGLFTRGQQFQLDRKSHSMSIVPDENVCVNGSQPESRRRSCRRSRIPLPPKVGSFLRGFR